jgi:alpha-tubulin suppressor-like RCC1 family protein
VAVTGLTSGVAAVSAGMDATCALTTAGTLRCWGYDGYGVLGNGSMDNSDVPLDVAMPPSSVASVTVGQSHACALTTSGQIFCWGRNDTGQLGTGSAAHATCFGADCSTVPVEVVGF